MSSRKHRDSQDVCARRVREIAQTGANRLCFECAQPGVTYTDVTVGCFVCTSCSGMLRGLNPPHRVKSISMTTFSPAEVDFLQNHGNEVGRRTWLCTLDPRDARADARDTPKLKEFLQDKYERKKWHFSRSKTRRDGEAIHTGPAPLAIGRPTRAPLWIWDRAAVVSPAESRSEFFSSRPTRSQSFRDHPVKDTLTCGVQRQRPGIVSSETGMNNQLSSFPALPRPSASSTFKSSFTLGRTLSAGTGAPLRSFPKSLSLDFGGLAPAHSTIAPPPGSQDKYAALSQLCSDSSSATAGGGSCLCSCPAPPDGAGSPDADPQLTSSGSCDTNPFCCGDGARLVLSPRNPFSSSSAGAPPRDTPPAPQENGCSDLGFFPADESVSRVTRPASVNPFTGHAYHSRGASLNPFI